jgi:hypothetical protein
VGTTKAVLLGDARDGERLAGKAGRQQVVPRDAVDQARRVDVARREFPMPCLVGALGLGIPFTGEHTAATERLEAEPHAADAREEIDEPEWQADRGGFC